MKYYSFSPLHSQPTDGLVNSMIMMIRRKRAQAALRAINFNFTKESFKILLLKISLLVHSVAGREGSKP